MRRKRSGDGLSVQAIAGTYVVLLGFDLPEADCQGLMGFAIHRTDHTEEEAYWLTGLKTFKETDPGFPPPAKYSTREHPIQGFTWSDYSAKPGHDYTYRVVALKGTPRDLRSSAETSVRVTTESPESGLHDIYFNRGAAASQEYAHRFRNSPPDAIGPAAFAWLSRGLYEAMAAFVADATGSQFELRLAGYEFHYEPFLRVLKAARDGGTTVSIVYDRRKDKPGAANDAAVSTVGIARLCTRRTATKSALSHNKFIVRLRNDQPEAVWTGGTNFSEGGIFGHSNVAHVVEDAAVAGAFSAYWDLLGADPENRELKPDVESLTPLPQGKPPRGSTVVFSPRSSLDALDWYAERAGEARSGLFMTFAFGMHESFQKVYRTSPALLRYCLMEKKTRPMKEGPERQAEEAKIDALRRLKGNRFAIGGHLRASRFDRWVAERLTQLNKNVNYVHNKFMLIDPLGSDPIVIAGSANFSAASLTRTTKTWWWSTATSEWPTSTSASTCASTITMRSANGQPPKPS